jgi:hypothetical protein
LLSDNGSFLCGRNLTLQRLNDSINELLPACCQFKNKKDEIENDKSNQKITRILAVEQDVYYDEDEVQKYFSPINSHQMTGKTGRFSFCRLRSEIMGDYIHHKEKQEQPGKNRKVISREQRPGKVGPKCKNSDAD